MVSILGANSVSGGYEVSNSLRFNNDDSPYLTFTPSSAGNRAVWTWSAWLKINGISGTYPIFTAGAGNGGGWSSGGTGTGIILYNDQFLTYWNSPSSPTYSSNLIRDPAAWYHVVLQANDTTLKVFVNGVEKSSKSISGDAEINNTNAQTIGRYSNNTDAYFDGYMTEINFVDGTAKAPTDFGEYNDDNVWIPKEYDGSYGSNGFRLEFKQTGTSANASGIGADTSGNGNHFAVTNLAATDVTTDTCVNNYATMNSLDHSGFTFSEGNLKVVTPSGNGSCRATIAMPSGKWYWEVLYLATTSGDIGEFGILATDSYPITQSINQFSSGGYSYLASGNKSGDGSVSSYGASYTTGDIIGVAFDADNGILAFYKNGSSQGNAFTGKTSKLYAPAISDPNGGQAATNVVNFGQEGSFAGNKTAQGNSDANGYGDFYYSPPSGYYALNTKNLAEFG